MRASRWRRALGRIRRVGKGALAPCPPPYTLRRLLCRHRPARLVSGRICGPLSATTISRSASSCCRRWSISRAAVVFLGNPVILWPALLALAITLRDWIVARRADAFLVLAFYFGPYLAWALLPRTLGFIHYYLPAATTASSALVYALTREFMPRWLLWGLSRSAPSASPRCCRSRPLSSKPRWRPSTA
jgi:hypothetical protein